MNLLHTVVFVLATSLIIQDVKSDCSLETSSPRPLLVTTFGSKHFSSSAPENIMNSDGEAFRLHCPKGFMWKSPYNGYREDERYFGNTNLDLRCESGNWYWPDDQIFVGVTVKCACSHSSAIFESRTSLPDCENYMTLILGHQLNETGSLKTMAMCYDPLGLQLKYVSYLAYPMKIRMLEERQGGDLNLLGLDIGVDYTKSFFKQLSTVNVSEVLRKDTQLAELLSADTFEYASLIQDKIFANELVGYEDMFNIVWLRALRKGIWMHWLNDLRIASTGENARKFNVRLGVSGVATVPLMDKCNYTRPLSIETSDGNTLSVPAQIWAHVRTLPPDHGRNDTKSSKEFVIVAHNSPFFKAEDLNSFCTSMCNEIPWLRNSFVGRLQQYPIYGLMQCCPIEDVANKLDNLPKPAARGGTTIATTAPEPNRLLSFSFSLDENELEDEYLENIGPERPRLFDI
ncbi:uncharacterized protein LOC115629935 isoform X2 [Scaptodrosophila lebanonensis]|uniref:Uncharacterized protein LOC115629935 isoform X2 n=1 Tax=Drosophila lebanonensis TaxID=7225 RepID=A0A6J2U5I4_DROLE|nr:uncharacterized protein LOC115629935 isoform X2 [Scaptodrosophila lebanonensis]